MINEFTTKINSIPFLEFSYWVKEMYQRKALTLFKALLKLKRTESWNLGSLANDSVLISFRESSELKYNSKFSQIHRLKTRQGPGYPGNEFWNHSKQHYLVYKCATNANPRRFDCDGETNEMMRRTETRTLEVEEESCPDSPRARPFSNDAPVLLLNLLYGWTTAPFLRKRGSSQRHFIVWAESDREHTVCDSFCLQKR